MLQIETPEQLCDHVGQTFGPGKWISVPQSRISAFAEATDDMQWIHLDETRAEFELGHPPVAHGYLTLALLAPASYELINIKKAGRMINYGLNKVRFISPVFADDKIRVSMSLVQAVPENSFVRAIYDVIVHVENREKPAMTAQSIILYFYEDAAHE